MSRNNIYTTLIGKLEKRLSQMNVGDILPNEQFLADEYKVCKATIRRALANLADDGLIKKINGVGSIVAGNTRVIPREVIFLCNDVLFFGETIKSFSSYALSANYLASVVPLHGDVANQERIISTVISRKPIGIVAYADPKMQNISGYQKLAECGIPVVYLIRCPKKINGNLLTFETENGIIGIIKRFYDEGCRKFALYGDRFVNPLAASERTHAFFAGLKKLRLVPQQKLICSDENREEEFLESFRHDKKRPDAVICLNDYCAGNFIRKLMLKKIDIGDIKISGFDHSLVATFIPHDLVTIEPPMKELGKEAAKILIRQVENPDFNFVKKKLASQLIDIKQQKPESY